MKAEFWHDRWANNQIGFHEADAHALLKTFYPRLGARSGDGVFVPLCGKSLDMRWLREQGLNVHGVELSPLAVGAFFDEAKITPTRAPHGALERWQGGGFTLYCGDLFALAPADVEGCRFVYDRAAMIALPPEMRGNYVAHLRGLFPHGARMLLITLEYPQEQTSGPPFSVPDAEVRSAYSTVERVASNDILAASPQLAGRGVTALRENAYLVDL